MVSSTEGLVTTSVVEDRATVAAVEDSAIEAALSRSMHFKHGGLMNRAHIHRPEYGFPAKHLH